MSAVWKYAVKRKDPLTKQVTAICNKCGESIVCSDRSTTSIRNHLMSIHGIVAESYDQHSTNAKKQAKNQPKINEFIQKKMNLREIISDLATDGLSIRVITRNKYIRQKIEGDGFKLPRNESHVMNLLHLDFEEKKLLMTKEIQDKVIRNHFKI